MKSGHFNSEIIGYDNEGMPEFDRAQDAEFFALFFKLFFKNGVYPNPSTNFQVLATDAMKVLVEPGQALIEGYFAVEDVQRELVLQAAESTMDRIDRVVLRLNLLSRSIDLYVVKGTPSNTPVAPLVNRPAQGEGGDIYELALADIYIPKNTTAVSQSRITDQRLNDEVCGIVEQLVDKIETSAYHAQLNALIQEYRIDLEAFMETIKGILGEDEAGALLAMINERSVYDLNGLTVPSDAVWTQLTEGTVMDPDLEYPFFTDVAMIGITQNDKVDLQADTPTGKLKIADFNQSFDGGIKVYAKQSYTGTVLKFPEVTKRKVNS